mgnify:FL=1
MAEDSDDDFVLTKENFDDYVSGDSNKDSGAVSLP